jgi:putative redox protein
MAERSTTKAELRWTGGQTFDATSGKQSFTVDGNGARGPSPIQMLAAGLAGCMATDVVVILEKGRHHVRSLAVEFTGLRAPEPPKKFEEISLRFTIDTGAPGTAVARAIELSRTKYCSVWHSMRKSIRLDVSYEIATTPRTR